ATGRSYVTEYRLMHRDGGECWVWQSGSALQGAPGDPPCIDGVMFDITEMRLRHAAFEGTVDAVHRVMGVMEFDMQGRVLSANERMLGWIGYALDELRGLHHSELLGDTPAGRTAFEALWQRLRRGEYETGEFRRTTREGAEFWIQASYNPIFDTDGTPFKVLLLATDINARRQMERALREAKARAEQAAAAKTMFLANMSHEIRTPMNAILGFTDVLLGGPLADEQRRHLQTVRQSGRALLALLNGILDTAKLEKGALELELADFSLRELVQHTADSLRLGAQAKGLAFDVHWAPDVGDRFHGDAQRIRQVLINLLGNAIKFTERGGVRLDVQRDGDGDTDTDTATATGRVHFLVNDTGIGIPADRIAAIFDPFSQADASTSRRFGGTGLGTTIARQLVELMGGRIDVESTPDVGSTFHVRLPLPPAQAPVAGPDEAGTPAIVPPPLDVLAVDDVAENRELVALALGRAGHRVSVAASAAEALTLFGRAQFDVVLMDLHMPGTDGLEAARSIRWLESAGERAPTPIVALTASVLAEDRLAAQKAGMEGFSPKPIELPVLLAEMARVTGRVAEPGAVPVPVAPAMSDMGLRVAPVVTTAVPAVVDWARGVRLWTSEAELLRNLNTFLDSQSDAPQVLARLLRVPDLDGARQLAHRLRGVSANLCCDALQAVAGLIETALAARDVDGASARLPALAAALAAVRESVDDAMTRAATEARERGALAGSDIAAQAARAEIAELPAVDRQATAALAAALLDTVGRSELDDAGFRRLSSALARDGEAPRVAAIGRALDDFDFSTAQDLLRMLVDHLGQASAHERSTPKETETPETTELT
ncbi:MAG: ATP-binding protein, partial [Pseudomonadota bacterium]